MEVGEGAGWCHSAGVCECGRRAVHRHQAGKAPGDLSLCGSAAAGLQRQHLGEKGAPAPGLRLDTGC